MFSSCISFLWHEIIGIQNKFLPHDNFVLVAEVVPKKILDLMNVEKLSQGECG